jgi:hypothetical protein
MSLSSSFTNNSFAFFAPSSNVATFIIKSDSGRIVDALSYLMYRMPAFWQLAIAVSVATDANGWVASISVSIFFSLITFTKSSSLSAFDITSFAPADYAISAP